MPEATITNRRVAILEDNDRKRDRLCGLIKLCRAVPVPVVGHAPQLNALPEFLSTERIDLLVCDHRLFEHGDYAPYYGAQAVERSYHAGVGGVVQTAYERNDAEISLRRSRRWIPALVHSKELTHVTLNAALLQADQEVREKRPTLERIPHRTIMTVRRVELHGATKVVKVVMSQWSAEQEVGFPLDIVPVKMRSSVAPFKMLIAQVNIEAASQEDLFFENFELPNPDVLKKAQSLFGRA
ncbi:MAG: hypothetical protein EXS35_12580 [Pedosphaera sp.]|nr:hypothetical protein [Pedosphaera sp.]